MKKENRKARGVLSQIFSTLESHLNDDTSSIWTGNYQELNNFNEIFNTNKNHMLYSQIFSKLMNKRLLWFMTYDHS